MLWIIILPLVLLLCLISPVVKHYQEKDLNLDILNDENPQSTLADFKLSNVKIFRERHTIYCNQKNGKTVVSHIPLGEFNDVPSRKNLTPVSEEDMRIIITAKSHDNKAIVIMKYPYTPENKEKSLRLKKILGI